VKFEKVDAGFFANVDFDGSEVRHLRIVYGLKPILYKNGIIR
jgi:hypothetical protein